MQDHDVCAVCGGLVKRLPSGSWGHVSKHDWKKMPHKARPLAHPVGDVPGE